MQLPAFPSETDPRFQEMLSKALALPAADAPAERVADSAPDLEACKQEMRAALEWAARNRDRWAGPKAAAPKQAHADTSSADARVLEQQHASRSSAKARSMFAAHRHRGSRQRSHHRARVVSRAGPYDGPPPDEPDAPSTPNAARGGAP